MTQQQMDFDQENQEGSSSYKSGYQEFANGDDYTYHFTGQKISRDDGAMQLTAGQRLVLAIVSLLILFLTFLTIAVLAMTGLFASPTAQNFAPVFGYMVLALFIAIIVVNVQFNRKQDSGTGNVSTSNQKKGC